MISLDRSSRTCRGTEGSLSHFVRRLDPEQGKPRRDYGNDALYKYQPGYGHFSIILDNEA